MSTLVSNPQGDQPSSSVPNNTSDRSTVPRNRASRRSRRGPESNQSSQTPQERHTSATQGNRRQRNGAGGGARSDGSGAPRPSRGGAVNNAGNVAEQTTRLTVDEPSSSRISRPQRSRKFGSQLTSSGAEGTSLNADRRQISKQPVVDPDELDLTSRLIHLFTHKDDALDCPICFNSIHPAQPIWSCSPSPEVDTCCWGTFHLKCIRSWAIKSALLLLYP
jgi:transcriptional repressor NF-X1